MMDNEMNLRNMQLNSKRKDATKAAIAEKVQANSKDRFKAVLEKKFKTTMIGALSKFELRFGYLWGFGKEPTELTEEEREMYEVWLLARTEILNNGNTQLRHSLDELSRYTLTYEGYRMNLPIKSIGENDE